MIKLGRKRERQDMYELIAYNIKQYRKELNLTQAQLAERTKYTCEFIRRIEAPNSKKYFSIDAICNIADALGINVGLLFENKKN